MTATEKTPVASAKTAHILVALFLTHASVGALELRQKNNNDLAVDAIWSDRHIQDSALYVHRHARSLSEEDRYEYLSQWVLPSSSHTTIRLALDFAPTSPPPTLAREEHRVTSAEANNLRRVPAGGNLVSPALDLVETASKLGRLAAVRSKLDQDVPNDELQQRCRLTMLGLIDLAAGQPQAAVKWFEELASRVENKTFGDFPGRYAETLAVHAGIQHELTREVAASMLYRMLQSQVRAGQANGPESWDSWVNATAGRLTDLKSLKDVAVEAGQRSKSTRQSSLWLPMSKWTGWSRGHGLPHAAWRRQANQVSNVASHTDDFLYYRIPLRGNFTVECDVTSFNWRDSHFMIAGTYVEPRYDHISYGIGSVRSARPNGTITPPLTHCDDWIRYRAEVKDGRCSTYLNGRLVHAELLTKEHYPWIAIRSRWDSDGAVRNIRISGEPVIPREIHLAADRDLAGWFAYFDESVGEDAHWQPAETGSNGIVARREVWLDGIACERLLQYHRPILEDGTIEYEFYYRPGECMVYPALDRRALILDSSGAKVHWITDGNFERNGTDPVNLSEDPSIPSGEAASKHSRRTLRLLPDDWNELKLTVTGDQIEVQLNGEFAYRGKLEPTNQRVFGLFYWSDRTEARVRNLVWHGSWPEALPPIQSQEFAGQGTLWLDARLPELPDHFEHDFTRDGLPEPKFFVAQSQPQVVKVSDVGLHVVLQAGRGYTYTCFGPKLQLHGDFDITAKFEGLDLTGGEDSSSGVYLMGITDDGQRTHSSVYRGLLRRPHSPDRAIAQAEFTRHRPVGLSQSWPSSTAEECLSGTLRLARRGQTVHCLIAEGDSTNFRLVHSEQVATEPTLWEGVRLMNATYSEMDRLCKSAVIWKQLSISAEKIILPQIANTAEARAQP